MKRTNFGRDDPKPVVRTPVDQISAYKKYTYGPVKEDAYKRPRLN